MKDITGKTLKVGDTVVVPLEKDQLRIGKIVKINAKKIKVASEVIEGLFYPTAILKIDENTEETKKTVLFANGDDTLFELSVKEVYKNLLEKLNITEDDIKDTEFFDKDGDNYVCFEYNEINYEIEPQ